MQRTLPGHFKRIALVLPTEFSYARGVLRGIIAATRTQNLYAEQSPRRGSAQPAPWLFRIYRGIYGHSSKYLARGFRDWEPDGIICQIYDDRLAKVYREARKPVVELFESRVNSEFPRVLPDDVATGAMAARYFIQRAFRHFAFFGASWMLWSGERQLGFHAEIKRAFAERAATGRSINNDFTFNTYGQDANEAAFRGSPRRRAAAMGTWLRSLPRPVALFVANDSWGVELVQAAREVGLHVPQEVAVLGVDNEELLCEIAYPPLSSIRLGSEQIGYAAVAMLERLLLGENSAANEIARIPPLDVVTRQSTDILAAEDPDVATALAYIREHGSTGLSVKQLLDAVPVNRRTLERRFVSLLGHTPLAEIHRVRFDRVKALLETDMPIYEIATRTGFATAEHMATSFLSLTGQTPTAYRRQRHPMTRWQRLPPAV